MEGAKHQWDDGDEFIVPDTLDECRALARDLGALIQDLDVQLGMLKSGGGPARSDDWHPRALAKKGHTVRQLRLVRSRIEDLRRQEDEEAAQIGSRSTNRAVKQLAQVQAASKLAKARARALYNWAQQEFPERSSEIYQLWRDCADLEGSNG